MSKKPTPDSNGRSAIANNQNSITAGPHGPVLIQDYELIEKLAVHAKGWGAHGTLTVTGDVSKCTKAKALQLAAKTPMLSRFSTVAGGALKNRYPCN